MLPFFLLLAIPAALALPTALPQDGPTKTLNTRAYFANPVISNPSALAWYQPYQTSSAGAGAGGSRAFYENTTTNGGGTTHSSYQCFAGSSYPALSSWLSFDTLWSSAASTITAVNGAPGLTPTIRSAILTVAAGDNIDARLVLAVIMQESTGRLAVPCTGVSNCGIMQAAPGSVGFDASNPSASIEQMIRDGVEGRAGTWPSGGPGLAYWLGQYGDPWRALRAYNTGSVPDESNLDATGGAGTVTYVADVANRLLGWDGNARAQC